MLLPTNTCSSGTLCHIIIFILFFHILFQSLSWYINQILFNPDLMLCSCPFTVFSFLFSPCAFSPQGSLLIMSNSVKKMVYFLIHTKNIPFSFFLNGVISFSYSLILFLSIQSCHLTEYFFPPGIIHSQSCTILPQTHIQFFYSYNSLRCKMQLAWSKWPSRKRLPPPLHEKTE